MNREALDRILKKTGHVPQTEQSYTLKGSDGTDYGKISYRTKRALDEAGGDREKAIFKLMSLKPADDEEKSVIDSFVRGEAGKLAQGGYFTYEEDKPAKQTAADKITQTAGYTFDKLGTGILSSAENTANFGLSMLSKVMEGVTGGLGAFKNPVSETFRKGADFYAGGGFHIVDKLSDGAGADTWAYPAVGDTYRKWGGSLAEGTGNLLGTLVMGDALGKTIGAAAGTGTAAKGIKAAKGALGAELDFTYGLGNPLASRLTKSLYTVKNGAKSFLSPQFIPFAMSAAGSAAKEAMQSGKNSSQALLYGTASGLVETATEKLFGGFAGTDIGDSVIEFAVKSPVVRKALNITAEGAEEAISTAIDPYLRMTALGEKDAALPDLGEYGFSAAQGILLAGVMGAATAPFKRGQVREAARSLNDSADALKAVMPDIDIPEPLNVKKATEAQVEKRQTEIHALAQEYETRLASYEQQTERFLSAGEEALANYKKNAITLEQVEQESDAQKKKSLAAARMAQQDYIRDTEMELSQLREVLTNRPSAESLRSIMGQPQNTDFSPTHTDRITGEPVMVRQMENGTVRVTSADGTVRVKEARLSAARYETIPESGTSGQEALTTAEREQLKQSLSSKRAKGVTLEQAEADIQAVTAKAKQQIERLVNPDGAVTADGAKLRRANTEFLSKPDALIDESFIRLYAETFADALDQSGNRIFKAAKQQNGDIAADIAGYAMTGTLRGTYDQQTGSAVKIYGKDFRKALQSAGQSAYSAKIRLYQETPVMSGQISALQDGKLRRVVQLSAAQRDGALYYQRYLDGDTEEIQGITAVEGKGGAVVAFGENASRLSDLTGTEPVTMVFGEDAVSMVRVERSEIASTEDLLPWEKKNSVSAEEAKAEGVAKAGRNDIIKSNITETDYGYALSGIPSRTEMERISRGAANDGAVVELSGADGIAGATLVYDDSATPETVTRDILAYYQDGVMPKNAIPDDAAFDDVRVSAERGSDYYKEDENGRKNEEQWQAEAIRRDDTGGDLYTGRTEGNAQIDRTAPYNQKQSDARTSGRDYTAAEAGISRQISKLLNKPLYHGTGADIAVFSPSYMDIGIHFGTREQAEARVSGIERPRMIQAGLEIKNPLYVREDIFGERSPKEYLEDLLEYAELTGEQKRTLRARFDALEQNTLKETAKQALREKIARGTHDVTWTCEPDGIYVELSIKDRNGRLHNIPRVEMLERAQIISVLSDSDVIALLNGDSLSAQGNEAIQDLAIDQLTHIEADYLRLRNLEESIQELGYDGLVYPNQNEGEGLSFAVFRDSQIKRTNEKNHDSGGQSDYSLKDSQHEEWGAEKQKNKHVIKTLPEIIQTISDTFGIPITTGNLSNKSASGEYRRRAETIRIRISNSLPTVAHELGHYFEHKYGLRKSRYIDQAMSMADSAFLEQYSKEKRAGEAIAEFVRVYLTDKAQARKEAPDFFAEFQQKLRSGNELSDLDTIASFVNEYMAADFYKRVDAAITNRKQQQSVKHLWSMRDQLKRKAYMELVDSFSPIKDMVDYVRELTGKATGGRKNAYVLATNSRNADAIANYIVSHGMTDMDGNTGIGMSLIDCIKDVDPKQIKVLDRYLVLKHSLEWLEPKDGKKKRVFADDSLQNTDRISREILKIEKKYPEMKEAAENLYQYQKHIMLNFLVKSGGMTMETAQYLWNLYPSYVPFYRAVGSRQSKVKGTFANQMLPIRRARGGGEQILSPLESIIENTHKMVKFALRNRVMQECAASADSVPGFGKLIEKVPPDMVSRTVGVKDYKDAVKERIGEMLGADDQTAVTEIIDEVFGDSVTGFSPAANAKKRIVTVLRGGKAEYYQIHDELLYESLAELAPGQLKGLLKWSQAIMTPMKLLTTSLNPLFSGSNALRDVQTAYYNSSTNNPIRFLLEYVESVKGILTESEDYQQYMALGGGNASELSANRDLMKKELRKIAMKDKGKAARLFHAMLHPVQLVADINDLIESIPRFQEYMNTVKSTGDKQAGIYAADDITTNFKRSGRTGRAVNALIMYNNAAVQGLDRLCRSFTDVPKDEALKRALKYLITGILTAAVLAWWNHENDEDGYENLSAYMKNNFYVVSLGDGKFVKIPKAREHGILSSAVERLADLSFGDKKAFYDFGGYLADQVIPPMLPSDFNGLPDALHSVLGSTVAGPFIDIGFNEDFKGTPIVSRSMENLPKQMQYNERTSMTAYWLGKVLHQSPLEIDHVISNATGVIGKANKSLLPMETGQRDLTIGMRGRFVADSNYSTDIIDRAYNIADEAEAAYKLEPTAENALNYEKRAVLTSFISKTNNLIKSLPEDEKRKARKRMLSKIKEWEVEMTPQDDRLVSTLGKDEKGELGFIMQSAPDSKLSYTKNKVQHSYTLTPEQYESFVEDIQNAVSKARAETMNMGDFKTASRDKKVDMLKSAQSKAMSDVRETHKKKYMGK